MNEKKITSIFNKCLKIKKINRKYNYSFSNSPLNHSKQSQDNTNLFTKLPHIVISNNLELEPLSYHLNDRKSISEKLLEKKRISLNKAQISSKNFIDFELKLKMKIKINKEDKNKITTTKFSSIETKNNINQPEILNKIKASYNISNTVSNLSENEKSKEKTKFVVFSKLKGIIKSFNEYNLNNKKKLKSDIIDKKVIKLFSLDYNNLPSICKTHESVGFPYEIKCPKYFSSSFNNLNKNEGVKFNNLPWCSKEKDDYCMKFVVSEIERHKKEYYRTNFGINLLE